MLLNTQVMQKTDASSASAARGTTLWPSYGRKDMIRPTAGKLPGSVQRLSPDDPMILRLHRRYFKEETEIVQPARLLR